MPLELAVTQGVEEGKSKLEVSNVYSRKQLTGFCRDEGWGWTVASNTLHRQKNLLKEKG